MVPSELLQDPNSFVDTPRSVYFSCCDETVFVSENPVSVYQDVHPILLLNQLENPDVDAEIKVLFVSNQLAKKSLYYELDGNFYRVFLIHNPEQLNLTSTLGFDTWDNGRLSHTSTWNAKMGIFVDKEAPQELIDHIAKSCELSYWDYYWNLSIHNGDTVTVHDSNHWSHRYTPYSWYTFMVNATP